jgi:hypothetical protein
MRALLTASLLSWSSVEAASTLVTWGSASGVDTSTAGYLKKTAGSAWGNAGAISTQELDSSAQTQGVSFKCDYLEGHAAMIGLGRTNANNDFGDIEFALYCHEHGIQVLVLQHANLAVPLALA